MRYWFLPVSSADVSTVSLVVLPPDVAEGIILATSDPYVSAVRCVSIFSHVSVVFFFSAVSAGQSIWLPMSMSF